MRPAPTTPAVAPASNNPAEPAASWPSRTLAHARCVSRASVRISASVCSATACGEKSGTWLTPIATRPAASRSTVL